MKVLSKSDDNSKLSPNRDGSGSVARLIKLMSYEEYQELYNEANLEANELAHARGLTIVGRSLTNGPIGMGCARANVCYRLYSATKDPMTGRAKISVTDLPITANVKIYVAEDPSRSVGVLLESAIDRLRDMYSLGSQTSEGYPSSQGSICLTQDPYPQHVERDLRHGWIPLILAPGVKELKSVMSRYQESEYPEDVSPIYKTPMAILVGELT